MIIVKLMGGLGNQMFQYATAKRLACRHNTVLKLDISHLQGEQKGYTPRAYELDCLNVNAGIASIREVAEITGEGENLFQTILLNLRRLAGLTKLNPNIYTEPHFHFDPGVMNLPNNTYLAGYWQSEKYFKEIEDTIRNEFTVRQPPGGKNSELAEIIQSVNSVSIHVRRGDYVTSQKVMHYHGSCGLTYYQRCMDDLTKKSNNPHLFIFSDDPGWVKEHIKFPFPITVIEHNPTDKGYEDLRLISLCRHNIIANSSFSWWGAWLNEYKDKLVYAPDKWFNKAELNTTDLLPKNWIKIADL